MRAATTLYQHNLTGILETAVRATNAQFDSPEILKRLDVRLLEVLWKHLKQTIIYFYLICYLVLQNVLYGFVQVSPGDTGWDVFSLDYHVDGPIATVTKHNFSSYRTNRETCACACCEKALMNIVFVIPASGVHPRVYESLSACV